MSELKIEYMPLTALVERRHRDNPKEHDESGIAASIARFGFNDPVTLDTTTDVIVEGHGRVKALMRLKSEGAPAPERIDASGTESTDWLVPVLRVAFTDDEERDSYVVAHNRLVESGGWSMDKLAAMMSRFKRTDSLASIGYTKRSYDQLMSRFRPKPHVGEDEVPEMPRVAVTQLGDVWRLGDHVLVCGDCTKVDPLLLRLGERGFGFTSPPYNAGNNAMDGGKTLELESGSTSRYLEGEDSLDEESYHDLLRGSLRTMLSVAEVACVNLQQLAGNKRVILRWLAEHADHFVDRAVWFKGQGRPALAPRVMNSRFEDLFFFAAEKMPKRTITTSSFHGTVSNVYEGGQQLDHEYSAIHSATMPVHLPTHVIGEHGSLADFVVEPFGGTGTTLSVAHQLGKRCAIVELTPAYCDVIIERWKKLSGGAPQRY